MPTVVPSAELAPNVHVNVTSPPDAAPRMRAITHPNAETLHTSQSTIAVKDPDASSERTNPDVLVVSQADSNVDLEKYRTVHADSQARFLESRQRTLEPDPAKRTPLSFAERSPDFFEVAPDQLGKREPTIHGWLWEGLIMRGSVTVLVSHGKTGKSTLLSLLLQRLELGGQLAGSTVHQGRALVFSEEQEWIWSHRHSKLKYGQNLRFHFPTNLPRFNNLYWNDIDHRCRMLSGSGEIELIVFDPMSHFLPYRDENNALQIQAAIDIVRVYAQLGTAVLLLHHPSKQKRGNSAIQGRGSSALAASADVVIDMATVPKAPHSDRRRILNVWSRIPDFAPSRMIEWSEDGTDYNDLGTYDGTTDLTTLDQTILAVLRLHSGPQTVAEISARWPETANRPSIKTLYNRIHHLVSSFYLQISGAGTPSDPYRFSLLHESPSLP